MSFLTPIFLLGMWLGLIQENPPPIPNQTSEQTRPEQAPNTQTDPPSDSGQKPVQEPATQQDPVNQTDPPPDSGQKPEQTPNNQTASPTDPKPEQDPVNQPNPADSSPNNSEPIEDRADKVVEGPAGEPNTALDSADQPITDGSVASPGLADPPTLPPVVDYDIHARLDPESKKIKGRLELRYTNHAPDIIEDLQFHIYPNAFKNNQSAYFWGKPNTNPDYWGYLSVRHAAVAGVDRTNDLEYIQAPGAPPGDRTVVRIPLTAPLLPGETLLIEMDFETKLPKAFDRTGYGKDFFFVAQWHPKIGVWETKGQRGRAIAGWNCHAFHRDTEFYANFGRYRVTIETPVDYVVGATGVARGGEKGIHGVSHTFEQDQIHDFAFVAGKRLIREERRFLPSDWINEEEWASAAKVRQVEPAEIALTPVTMILLIQPEHRDQIDRHFEAMANAIKYFGLWFGPYPYEAITMVDPPADAASVGGMEYPTLVTLGASLVNPRDYLDLEEVIIHEFAHQYWYGMVGFNEFEESWLDEGIATYCTGRLVDILYGPAPIYANLNFLGGGSAGLGDVPIPISRVFGLRDGTEMDRFAHKAYADQYHDQIVRAGWTYFSGKSYAVNSYYKPATALWQLEQELGSETMVRALSAFFQKWAYKHPGTRDFIDTVEAESGRDLTWFFDEMFLKPGFLDYEVDSVQNLRVNEAAGYRNSEDGPVLGSGSQETVHSSVVIKNLGSIRYPVEILIAFEDGQTVLKHWQGDYPWVRYDFYKEGAVREVVIDPERKIVIDGNRANNSYRATPDPAAARKWYTRFMAGTQHLLQTLAGGL